VLFPPSHLQTLITSPAPPLTGKTLIITSTYK
jgi:hypothetical protein